ncbi:MAG: class B sortase [Clostridia bacterium]|nr:class B sortase [Clostridia bacterium]
MKKRIILSVILAVLFILTAIPINLSLAQEFPTQGVTLELIYFRQSPLPASVPRVKGCETIAQGENVTVLCESDGFYLLKYNGYYGFARMKDIELIGSATPKPTAIPIQKPTATPTLKPTATIVPKATPTPNTSSGDLVFYTRAYSAGTLEKVYFRVNPTSATTPRVSGCETIPKGKEVIVLGINGDFYYITYNGHYGYARTQDIRVYGPSETTIAPMQTSASTPKPTATPSHSSNSSVAFYEDKYSGATKEKVYFRVNPTSATTPRVNGCDTIASGKDVIVLGQSGNFYYITYNGYYGFARKQDIRVYGIYVPPTPTPAPTAKPTTAPIPSSYSLTSEEKELWNSVPSRLIAAAKKNSDAKGWIYIPGTKTINYPIMYGDNYYYSDHTIDRKEAVQGSIYLHVNRFANINVISGHNSRKSKTMFHELHHIQARLIGKSKCEYCGTSVSYIDPNKTIFNISYGGYSVWQLFAMYETDEDESKDVLKYNMQHPDLEGSSRTSWINYQISRSQVDFNVKVGNEPLAVLVTCGDYYDSATAQSRLYMFLKALY